MLILSNDPIQSLALYNKTVGGKQDKFCVDHAVSAIMLDYDLTVDVTNSPWNDYDTNLGSEEQANVTALFNDVTFEVDGDTPDDFTQHRDMPVLQGIIVHADFPFVVKRKDLIAKIGADAVAFMEDLG